MDWLTSGLLGAKKSPLSSSSQQNKQLRTIRTIGEGGNKPPSFSNTNPMPVPSTGGRRKTQRKVKKIRRKTRGKARK